MPVKALWRWLMEEIRQTVAEKPEFDYEIVAVNDCSPDNVLSVLRQEAEADPKVKVVDLAKNGGRHCALMAGFHVASGDYVVCIDDDLQCPTRPAVESAGTAGGGGL